MKLKTIHARTMQEAMELVREQMGAEAVIVATHEDEKTRGVRVTAASDTEDRHIPEGERTLTFEILQLVGNALDDHGTPPKLADKILNSVVTQKNSDPYLALSGALGENFDFIPLPETGKNTQPIMLIGPPGVGKTSACAKIAARSLIAGNSIHLITTDTVRAKGVEQLESYAGRLGHQVAKAPDPLALIEAIENAKSESLIIIDTMGVNPYRKDDIGKLEEFVGAISVEPILVLSAGRDSIDGSEIARAYAAVTPTRMLVTGLDMVRRLGSVLAAIDSSGLAFSDVSPSANIVNGLRPVNQNSLARLLLPPESLQPNPQSTQNSFKQFGEKWTINSPNGNETEEAESNEQIRQSNPRNPI